MECTAGIWVCQSDLPDLATLKVLFGLNLSIFIAIIVSGYLIRNRILSSMRGPSDALLVRPTIISESFTSLFIGLILLELTNLISHGSAILYPSNSAYLLIGEEDFVMVFGIIFLNIGIFSLISEMTKSYDELIKRPHASLLIFPLLFVLGTFVNENIRQFTNYLLLGAFLFIILYNYSIIAKNRGIKLDKMEKARVRIALIISGISNLVFLVVPASFLPKDGFYPTRQPTVELLLLSHDLTVIIVLFGVYLLVFMPKELRRFFKISNEEYLKYADFRFDDPSNLGIRLKILDDGYEAEIEEELEYILSYSNDENLILEQIKDEYNGHLVNFSLLDEELLEKLLLPTSEILYLDAYNSKTSNRIMKSVERHFFTTLKFEKEGILFKNSFFLGSGEEDYAIIVIVPSLWNLNRKFWLVMIKPDMAIVVIDFLKKYKVYLENLAYQKQSLISIVKFPRRHGGIQEIPHIDGNQSIPDQNFFKILS